MLKKITVAGLVLTLGLSTSGCSQILETLGGGVVMDPYLVEQNIIATYANDGVSVTVECPDPFVAKVGESRNCLVTDDYGETAMAKVTVENREGYFTWVAE